MSYFLLLILVFESYASSEEKIWNLGIHIVIILFLPCRSLLHVPETHLVKQNLPSLS